MKIFDKIKTLWYGLIYGMKSADEILTASSDEPLPNIGIHQAVHTNRVSKALLQGEVTQAVEELRYRTYKVDREAKMYEYYSPTLVKKYEFKDDSKFVKYENSDNLEVITIQPNNREVDDLNTSLFENTNANLEYKDNLNKKYTITIERNIFPRFKLEEYTKRLVVKHKTDNTYILDFYVSKYPNDKDVKSKGFVREIERMLNGGRSSDVFDFERVHFVTHHSYKVPDMIYFAFRTPIFLNVIEYDGHYIVKFRCVLERTEDEVERYHSESMEKKYQENQKKEVVLNLLDDLNKREYICEKCGKIMVYDPVLIDSLNASQGRDITDDEEYVKNKSEALSYLDAEMSEQTTGHIFCRNCLKEYLEERNEI